MTIFHHTFTPWTATPTTRTVAPESHWRRPLRWNRAAERAGERVRAMIPRECDLFGPWGGRIHHIESGEPCVLWHGPTKGGKDRLCRAGEMLVDPFHKSVGGGPVIISGYRHATLDDVRRRTLAMIDATPWIDWLVTTETPENVAGMLPAAGFPDAGVPGTLGRRLTLPNLFLGATIRTQADADARIPALLQAPAAVRWVWCVPREAINLRLGWDNWICSNCGFVGSEKDEIGTGRCPCGHEIDEREDCGIGWCVVSGERGPDARPLHPGIVRSLRDQCVAASTPFWFDGFGEWLPHSQTQYRGAHFSVKGHKFDDENLASRVGHRAAGRTLDGRTWDELPRTSEVDRA